MGLMLAEPGFHTRCFVEWEEYPRSVLIAAQRAGYFAPAPIWNDLRTFDARPFRGAFDTVLAGYPCQPFSHAGQRRGEDDERHLWPEVARVIREVEPEWVFLENVSGHVTLGAETVLRELWDMGWTPAAGLFSASETGAPHERLRWFCVAYRDADADAGWVEQGRSRRGAGESQGQGAERKRLRAWPRGGGEPMAHPDGGHPGAEREQRGGEQRLQPEGGHVENAIGAGAGGGTSDAGERRRDAVDWRGEGLRSGNRAAGADWPAADGQSQRSPVDDAPSPRRDDARIGAETDSQGGERLSCAGRGAMAAPGGAERQGQQPGQRDARGRQEPHGHSPLRGGTGLFPPGPGDAAAWDAVLRSSPDMAPAAAARDLHAWARRLEADGREWWEAQTEPEFCRLVDGLADRSSRLRLLGNGVFPLAAAYAWRTLAVAHGLGPVDMEAACGDAGVDANGPFLTEAAE